MMNTYQIWCKGFNGFFKKSYSEIVRRCKRPGKYFGLAYMSKTEWLSFLEATEPVRRDLHDAWVKSGYIRKLVPSIDRVDSSKGYLPGNCRWITLSENSSNGGKAISLRKSGENHNAAKLTWNQVREMRQLYKAGGWTQKSLSNKYGVSMGCVDNVLSGRHWKEAALPKDQPK